MAGRMAQGGAQYPDIGSVSKGENTPMGLVACSWHIGPSGRPCLGALSAGSGRLRCSNYQGIVDVGVVNIVDNCQCWRIRRAMFASPEIGSRVRRCSMKDSARLLYRKIRTSQRFAILGRML